jgi:hypothetical protein
VTGVPYVRSLRLAWSASAEIPTWEPANQTRELPGEALQAVLAVDVRKLPADVALRVLWYHDGPSVDPIYADSLESVDDGEHYFALCLRERGHLVPLPKGAYRVELRNDATALKSIPFEVVEREDKP